MNEQYNAREWYKAKITDNPFEEDRFPSVVTTGGRDASGFLDPANGYVDELDIAREHNYDIKIDPASFNYSSGLYGTYLADLPEYNLDSNNYTVKPFLPGTDNFVTSRWITDSNSLFAPDKTAGVDSLGLLSGALGMSRDSSFLYLNAFNQDVPTVANSYAFMTETSVTNPYAGGSGSIGITGLDAHKKPAYYVFPSQKSFTEMPARFTRGDLERITVIVPSLAEVQQGDLLVNFNVDGEPVVGIVVATLWDKTDSTVVHTMTTSDFLENIIVAGVRHGLNQVTIGRWGNPEGSFGGFTQTPEAFHVRRLLALPASMEMAAKGKEEWDLFDEVSEKLRTSYPPKNRVPRGYDMIVAINDDNENIANTDEDGDGKPDADAYIVDALIDGTTEFSTAKEGNFFYRELPSTSLRDRVTQSLFKTDYPDDEADKNAQMQVLSITGWRNSGLYTNQYALGYHMGVDIVMAAKEYDVPIDRFPILAPEKGKFFIWRSGEAAWPQSLVIDIDGDNVEEDEDDITLDSYKVNSYGYIGVLVTNPENVEQGRIYLFCHLGDHSFGYDTVNSTYLDTGNFQQIAYRDDYTNGTLFSAAAYPGSYSTAISVDKGDKIAYVGDKGANRHIHLEVYEYFSDATDPSNWLRVDPLSVFNSALFQIRNGETEVDSYGWWSTLYGNRDDYVTVFDALYNKAGIQYGDSEARPEILPIDLKRVDFTKAFSEAWNDWIWAQSSIYYHDLIEAENDLKPKDVFLPDNWDLERIP